MTNSGVAAARNAGMALAVGDWIALLDSDDAWEPTKLEVQMAAHARTPEAAWSVTGCEVVDATDAVRAGPRSFAGAFLVFQELGRDPEAAFDEHLTRVEVTAAGGRHLCFTGDLFGLLFHGNVCLPSSAVIHRRVLERLGPFDPSLRVAEETEFFHRVASAFPVTIVMSPLVRYRAAQEGSLTAGVNIGRLTEAALHSLDAAARLRALSPVEERARVAGRRNLLLRLAYAQLSVRDGAAARRTLRRLAADRLPLGRRGAAIWAASLLPAPALAAMHAGKRLLRRRRARRGAS